MGEGTNRLTEPSADELAEQVERSRNRLDTLVAELDQRRHLLARLKQTLSEHPVWVAAALVLAVGAVAAAVPLALRQRRKQQKFQAQLGRWSRALGRMLHHPEQVARTEPSLPAKLLTTAATSLTSILIKRAGNQAFPEQRR
jgi:hypothetical protein